jgi:hypothetical protein
MKKLCLIVAVVGTLVSTSACSHLQPDMSRDEKAGFWDPVMEARVESSGDLAKDISLQLSNASLIQFYPNNLVDLLQMPQVDAQESVFLDMQPWMLFNICY